MVVSGYTIQNIKDSGAGSNGPIGGEELLMNNVDYSSQILAKNVTAFDSYLKINLPKLN